MGKSAGKEMQRNTMFLPLLMNQVSEFAAGYTRWQLAVKQHHRSAKPLFAGSIPARASNNTPAAEHGPSMRMPSLERREQLSTSDPVHPALEFLDACDHVFESRYFAEYHTRHCVVVLP